MSTDQAVVIWGEILWDRFPDGDRLGGAPANVAWHLGQAGGWAQLVSRVGDDRDGRKAIEVLSQVCDAELVQIDRERATGEVLVAIEGGEPRYTLVPGRAWERIECTTDVATALGDASIFVYGTLAQHTDEGIAGWRDAIAAAKKCLKVCDVNLRRTTTQTSEERRAVDEAIAAADIVKVNDKELARIAEWFGWQDPVAQLRAGRRVVAITHGQDGSTLYGDSGVVAEVAGVPAIAGGDNVGCGDAYVAILVHGMTLGWDLLTCGSAASRWAAAVASERGATPLFRDERIDELLGESVS